MQVIVIKGGGEGLWALARGGAPHQPYVINGPVSEPELRLRPVWAPATVSLQRPGPSIGPVYETGLTIPRAAATIFSVTIMTTTCQEQQQGEVTGGL